MVNNSLFCLVNEAILKEIIRKKQILEREADYFLHYDTKKKKVLHAEANKHSVDLELEGYNNSSPEEMRNKANERARCERNLTKAMTWGFDSYDGILSLKFIEELGKRVDPLSNKKGYRTDKVRILGATSSPPSPEKLQRELKVFLFENNDCIDSELERALHTHFHIARIHPFLDGNGRIARLTQNIMLEHSNFLPAMIKPSERTEYIHLLDKAVSSYRYAEAIMNESAVQNYKNLVDVLAKPTMSAKEKAYYSWICLDIAKAKMTPEQYDFYNFLAMKIRDSLQREMDILYHLRKRKNTKP